MWTAASHRDRSNTNINNAAGAVTVVANDSKVSPTIMMVGDITAMAIKLKICR